MIKSYTKKKVTVIGGGLTGLVIGYRLSQKGYKITVFEKEKELGGLAGGFKLNGTYLDKTYHHIFKSDKEIIELVDELGLGNKLQWIESKIAVYYKEALYPFVTPMDLLRFKPLGLTDKVRLGLIGIYLQKDNNWKKYVNIPAWKWMKKWCGLKAYKVIWEPLLRGKFHDRYKDISMAWLWARIHTRGGSKDADGKERLGYLIGGFQQIIDELAKKIRENGGIIKTGVEIGKEILICQTTDQDDSDLVISTIPAEKIDYLGAVNVIFTTKQNLSRYYWHNINDLKSPFLAFIQQTNFVDKGNYQGEHVYYLGTYVPRSHRFWKMNDEDVFRKFFGYLKKIFPDFDEKQIGQKFIFKFNSAQHVVTCDYESKIPAHKINDRLYQVNFSQIFPEDRGMNYAVKEAEQMVTRILELDRKDQ